MENGITHLVGESGIGEVNSDDIVVMVIVIQ
jgi:hypothetical protein